MSSLADIENRNNQTGWKSPRVSVEVHCRDLPALAPPREQQIRGGFGERFENREDARWASVQAYTPSRRRQSRPGGS